MDELSIRLLFLIFSEESFKQKLTLFDILSLWIILNF
jgi:hypothetical protein